MAATTDFKSLFAALRPLLLAPSSPDERFGIMMRARHGVGKSQVVYQTADAIYWDTQEQRLGYKSDGVFTLMTAGSLTTRWSSAVPLRCLRVIFSAFLHQKAMM